MRLQIIKIQNPSNKTAGLFVLLMEEQSSILFGKAVFPLLIYISSWWKSSTSTKHINVITLKLSKPIRYNKTAFSEYVKYAICRYISVWNRKSDVNEMIQKILFMHFLRLYIELQCTVMYNKNVQAVNCKAMKKYTLKPKAILLIKIMWEI